MASVAGLSGGSWLLSSAALAVSVWKCGILMRQLRIPVPSSHLHSRSVPVAVLSVLCFAVLHSLILIFYFRLSEARKKSARRVALAAHPCLARA